MSSDLQGVRAGLTALDQGVASGAFGRARLWSGAGVSIVERPPGTPREGFYLDPRLVVTPFARELSWLFSELWSVFRPILDHASKIEFFGRLGNAATRYQARVGSDEALRDLLGAVIHEAYAIADEIEEGSFEYLLVASGRAIYDDFVDEADREGYLTIEETRQWFAERGLE